MGKRTRPSGPCCNLHKPRRRMTLPLLALSVFIEFFEFNILGGWHGEHTPILMEPVEDKETTIRRLKRENSKLLLRIAEYEAREH